MLKELGSSSRTTTNKRTDKHSPLPPMSVPLSACVKPGFLTPVPLPNPSFKSVFSVSLSLSISGFPQPLIPGVPS